MNLNDFNLTKREIEVLKLIAKGKSNLEIAKTLYISIHTSKMHIFNIFIKMNVQDRTQAVVKTIKYCLIPPDFEE